MFYFKSCRTDKKDGQGKWGDGLNGACGAKKNRKELRFFEKRRAAEDRTRDLLHPMQARYQTALRPVFL